MSFLNLEVKFFQILQNDGTSNSLQTPPPFTEAKGIFSFLTMVLRLYTYKDLDSCTKQVERSIDGC